MPELEQTILWTEPNWPAIHILQYVGCDTWCSELSGDTNKSLGSLAVADMSAQRSGPTLEKKSEELQTQWHGRWWWEAKDGHLGEGAAAVSR